jgi:nitrogen regulatory protein PII-like uncharacterized protein
MSEKYSLDNWVEFDKEEGWGLGSRRVPAEYCTIIVMKDPKRTMKFFFDILDGEEVFCKIRKDWKTERIREYIPCRLTNTKIFTTRGIPINEAIMI